MYPKFKGHFLVLRKKPRVVNQFGVLSQYTYYHAAGFPKNQKTALTEAWGKYESACGPWYCHHNSICRSSLNIIHIAIYWAVVVRFLKFQRQNDHLFMAVLNM